MLSSLEHNRNTASSITPPGVEVNMTALQRLLVVIRSKFCIERSLLFYIICSASTCAMTSSIVKSGVQTALHNNAKDDASPSWSELRLANRRGDVAYG